MHDSKQVDGVERLASGLGTGTSNLFRVTETKQYKPTR
jgi:hypothetical protein